jgi:hypothetical protein
LRAGHYRNWLQGPLASEWLLSAPFVAADGSVHPQLHARFAIRAYAGPQSAKVDVTVENGWAYAANPQGYTYDGQVNIGGSAVYSLKGLNHYARSLWKKTFWWGGQPNVTIQHNTGYLIASKALPNYDQTIPFSTASLNALSTQYGQKAKGPMQTGMAETYMPNTGGRSDIGLLPGWQVTYLLTMDPTAKQISLDTADMAGSWPVHYRDQNTDRPVSLFDYPYITASDPNIGDSINPATHKPEMLPLCVVDCPSSNILHADTAHTPEHTYLPYLVTGDHFYLEELEYWAMWAVMATNPGYRNYGQGLVHRTQVRGQAWSLRTLADAAYIVPDQDPFKQQFQTLLDNNLNWYNGNYVNSLPDNTLGFITEYAMDYNNGIGMSPWQDDFFTSAVGRAAELGFAKANTLLGWKARFPIARMTDPGFCWIFGSAYSLNTRASSTSPFYTSMANVYTATEPTTLTGLACASPAMASALKLTTGEMVGYSYSALGYPANMQPALAYAADSGSSGGAAAWAVFMGRHILPDYTQTPGFAIVPRSVSGQFKPKH